MYKVLVQNAKIPVWIGKKSYSQYNINHTMECQHASLKKEFGNFNEVRILNNFDIVSKMINKYINYCCRYSVMKNVDENSLVHPQTLEKKRYNGLCKFYKCSYHHNIYEL